MWCWKTNDWRSSLLALMAGLGLLGGAGEGAAAEEPTVDFRGDVLPILRARCAGCHNADDASGGLNLESFAALAAGGGQGPAFTAGVAASSRMFRMAAGTLEPVMPPDGEEPLSASELDVLKAWIEEGAAGPEGDAPRPELQTPDLPAAPLDQQPVTALAITPDGKRIARARFGRVEIWDAAGQAPLQTLDYPAGKINALRFDRAGKRLLVAGGVSGLQGGAVLYEWAAGKVLQSLEGHRDVLYTARFSPDETRIATAGYDRRVVVWDVASGEVLQTLEGHNGAVFRVAFSPDGSLLASASADETVKLWAVASGQRMDTLPQPQGEVLDVLFTPAGDRLIAAGADQRFRVWKIVSRETPRINPLLVTRFADESPLTRLRLTPDGERLLVVSQGGRVKAFDTQAWQPQRTVAALGEAIADLAIFPRGDQAVVALMDGEVIRQPLQGEAAAEPASGELASGEPATAGREAAEVEPVYVQLDLPAAIRETAYREAAQAQPLAETAPALLEGQPVAEGRRGLIVDGVVAETAAGEGEVDWYALEVEAGEVWVIEATAAGDRSPLDTVVEVCAPATGLPLTAVRLQAVRESYFTFRGKDSTQSGDFRLFAWEEMELDDYLYAGGEVTKLAIYPRGPDSGFNVYPGSGNRWTYFGTSPVTHALGEPAYIVRPLRPGQPPVANGLPVFEVPVMNDDDPWQQRGTDSRLIFTAPATGTVLVNLRDSRGLGGDDLRYRLTARPAEPDFAPAVQAIGRPIPQGAGRELTLRADRLDGYQGPIRFDISGLPAGLHVSTPVWIEAGQDQAAAVVWADPQAPPADAAAAPLQVTATALIAGRKVEHAVANAGTVQRGGEPKLQVVLQPADREVTAGEPWTLRITPGGTVRARVRVIRHGFTGEVALGKETAARNAPHGVFVDNIGLNGLLIVEGAEEREFFLTAAPIAAAGTRSFFLEANVDGGIASRPITLEVVE